MPPLERYHPLDELSDDELTELREDAEYELRQRRKNCMQRPVMHITSMPVDPLAADFGARINRIRPHDNEPDRSETHQENQLKQGELWE